MGVLSMAILAVSIAVSSMAHAEKGLWERLSSVGSTSTPKFLKADQAFQALIDAPDGQQLHANFRVTKGYYLYKDKISFSLVNTDENKANLSLGEPVFPPAEVKVDESFGRSEVYHHDVVVKVPLLRISAGGSETIKVKVKYQGCADKGFCYPPITKIWDVFIPAIKASEMTTAPVSKDSGSDTIIPEQTQLASTIAGGDLVGIVLTFFGLGLLLSLTPCVFPMIPILSGIIVGQGEKAKHSKHTFMLSLVFVLSMSVAYTIAGIIAGLTGANLQSAFQNPWIISVFSLLFVVLALSMFGFYELQMPSRIQNRLNSMSQRFNGGQWLGVMMMGLFSALIVGPCVAPPMIGALIYISQSGDALTGGLALFAMSMGMGVPLLVLGASAGKLLPHSGAWMDVVKAVFGVMLLGLAVWMLERILPAWSTLLLWSALFIVSAIYLGALEPLNHDDTPRGGWKKLWKGLGVFFLLYGLVLMLGAFSGGKDMLHPLNRAMMPALSSVQTNATAAVEFKTILTTVELDEQIALAGQKGLPVMLDYYADWCVSCKEMERETFNNPVVAEKLQRILVLQADVTSNDEDAKGLLTRFGLYGPPSILFFDRQGRELKSLRLVGFLGPEEFSDHLDQLFERS